MNKNLNMLNLKKDLGFINSLKEIDNRDDLSAVDDLYEYVDHLLDSNDYSRIMKLIDFLIEKDFSMRVLIGVLTITHSKKNFLNNRVKVINTFRNKGVKKGLTDIQINSILKGF